MWYYLNDDGMSREVDSPGKCCCTHQHFYQSISKQPLHKVPVRTKHASVVNAEPIMKEILQWLVTRAINLENKITQSYTSHFCNYNKSVTHQWVMILTCFSARPSSLLWAGAKMGPSPLEEAVSLRAVAVFTVALRAWTNTMTWVEGRGEERRVGEMNRTTMTHSLGILPGHSPAPSHSKWCPCPSTAVVYWWSSLRWSTEWGAQDGIYHQRRTALWKSWL